MRCQGEQAKMLSMETKRLKSIYADRGVSVHPSMLGLYTSDLVQSVEWL
jgi:hypothetical protein